MSWSADKQSVMPKVSVVIPTCNRVSLLRRAIASVIGQTFQDFEIIVADDASADGTAEMIRGLSDARIKHFRHDENRGVAVARNTAIAHARGEYIAFLDDDDEWLPQKLHRQVELMERLGDTIGAICCGNYEVDTSTNRIIAEMKPFLRGHVFEKLFTRGLFNRTSTVVVRAKCFERVGVFDPSFQYGEDFDMWLRLAQEYDFDYVAAPLAKVYLQPNGLTQNFQAIISGAERDLSKYRAFYARHPRVYSRRLHRLATYHCLSGNVKQGRRVFWRAVAKDCLAIKSYVCLALSFFGPRAFKSFYAAKDRLSDALAPTSA
jgi:glycosyltransferase involved in cell wall biosynthesis